MATENYLAIDLGAESGRGMLGSFDGERISLTEIGRFPTGQGAADIGADGIRRWDWPRILTEIKQNVDLAYSKTEGALAGIGVDSWGVDFGLLDSERQLVEMPLHYRNDANPSAMARVFQTVPRNEVWQQTGIQPLAFNTLYQLAAIQQRDPALLEKAKRLLLVPDLVHHSLTGGAANSVERTNGSTSQMMTPGASEWNRSLLSRLDIPNHFLGTLTDAGSRVGQTVQGVPVYTPATHDTASAVVAVPFAGDKNGIFLSSGTWSLLGTELPKPLVSSEALAAGFSNEGGVCGTTRFLKNIMGLWLVQECRRSLNKTSGQNFSYAHLAELAGNCSSCGGLFDATHERFLAPQDMAEEIRLACRESGQQAPQDAGELICCCLESLAMAYRSALHQLETLTHKRYEVIHIVGGGSQNDLLNQWTADACGIPVIAGPTEVTALGNVLGQMVGSGAITGWLDARELSQRSSEGREYVPRQSAQDQWARRAEQWARIKENQ